MEKFVPIEKSLETDQTTDTFGEPVMELVNTNRRILLVEDDPDDQLLFLDLCRESDIANQVRVIGNEEELARFISDVQKGTECKPCLTFIDSVFPPLNAKEIKALIARVAGELPTYFLSGMKQLNGEQDRFGIVKPLKPKLFSLLLREFCPLLCTIRSGAPEGEFEWSCLPSEREFILFSPAAGLLAEEDTLNEAKARKAQLLKTSLLASPVAAIYRRADCDWRLVE